MGQKGKGIMKKAVWLAMAAALTFSLGVGDTFAKQCNKLFPTVVRTKYGKVEGFYNTDTTVAWKGVPYAKPPVGDLRWKAPQSPERWSGVRDATEPCLPCLQLKTSRLWVKSPTTEGSSEDCLYLDIYRPSHRRGNLPVYVYFHGGSNHFGSASDYDGSRIAEKSDMVVVIAQQRLGPMGWFTHPALRHGESMEDDSGNFGTLDNIKALEWIRRNIRAFGGNPHKVTITGESAGAHNVMNMVISPLAKGLFHRAMSQSGGMTPVATEEGEAQAEQIIDMILLTQGISRQDWDAKTLDEQEEFLRGLDGSAIWTAIFPIVGTQTYDAYQDGYVIPDSVVATIRSGDYNKVPIILGANQSEMKAFLPLFAPLVQQNWDQLIYVLEGYLTIGQVFVNPWDQLVYDTTGYFGSRNWRAKFVDERARALREHQRQVYAYQFNWGEPGSGPTPYDIIYGAMHTQDIPFFFGADESTFGYGFNPDNDTAGRQALSDAMMTYLGNFARTGNPNGICKPWWRKWRHRHNQENALPRWRQWSNDQDAPKAMVFDADFDQAILGMSNEEVNILEEMAKLDAYLSTWPAELQAYGPLIQSFQWYLPE